MREKKKYTILTFRTTTDAMAMEKKCAQCGIPGRLIPVPREITAGCGLAWRMPSEDYPDFREALDGLQLLFQQITELWL